MTTPGPPRLQPSPAPRDGRPRVALFGEFGIGNAGNDESCRTMLALLAHAAPGVDPVLIARDPQRARAILGVPAVAIAARPRRSPATGRLGRAIAPVAGKAADLIHLWRVVGSADAVVVPGTGLLDEPRRRVPGGSLTWLSMVTAVARARHVPVAWLAIGGGRFAHRLPALVAATAARCATYRSYRDTTTRDALAAVWAGAARDPVVPDVVYARADPPAPRPTTSGPWPAVVGVSVIDLDPDPTPGASRVELRDAYVASMAALVARLAGEGAQVRLLVADDADVAVVDRVCAGATVLGAPAAAMSRTRSADFDDIRRAVRECDVVVASRFHVLIAATLARRPVVALSHADKVDQLMATLGLDRFRLDVLAADAESCLRLVLDAHREHEILAASLDTDCRRAHAAVGEDVDRMLHALRLAHVAEGVPV